jgi:outer membrane lipoprotein-sorting protein
MVQQPDEGRIDAVMATRLEEKRGRSSFDGLICPQKSRVAASPFFLPSVRSCHGRTPLTRRARRVSLLGVAVPFFVTEKTMSRRYLPGHLRIWITMVMLLLLAAPVCAQDNDAEKLFRAMEKKVRAAKSLEIVFEGSGGSDGVKVNVKGKALLAPGGMYRIQASVDFGGKSDQGTVISDGKTIYNKSSDSDPAKTREARPADADRLHAYLGRLGVVVSFSVLGDETATEQPKDFDLDKTVPVADFKLGVKEKVGAKDAQVVECAVTVNRKTGKMVVWIDPQTQLPLKRSIEVKEGRETRVFVETYTSLTMDAKLDTKLFEVPK